MCASPGAGSEETAVYAFFFTKLIFIFVDWLLLYRLLCLFGAVSKAPALLTTFLRLRGALVYVRNYPTIMKPAPLRLNNPRILIFELRVEGPGDDH